ncbi:hypothetical protein ACR784_20225 [Sphingobacterium multivorum]|uniref:hypothetical protein n=1 Tax=Sphingobacterium multivorum TaxID=28454 RepID=UPI003DA34BF1
MFGELNANGYGQNALYYDLEFENILAGIIHCYYDIVNAGVSLVNKENDIRDVFLKEYLKKHQFKVKYGLQDYLFDFELPENTGRIDIRVMPINPFLNDDAYYVIECKRLNAVNQKGTTGLNAEYITEGMLRFVGQKYSCYYRVNGMIGFITDFIDIDDNIKLMNHLLTSSFINSNTKHQITFRPLAQNFAHSYLSVHDCNGEDISLYHLMFDVSRNIRKKSLG